MRLQSLDGEFQLLKLRGRHGGKNSSAPFQCRELTSAGLAITGVGQVRVADIVATYYGTQHLTTNNRGVEIYGGSELTVVHGDFDALLALTLPEDIRLASTLLWFFVLATDQDLACPAADDEETEALDRNVPRCIKHCFNDLQ